MLRSHDETTWTLADLKKQLRHEVETREKSSLGQSDKDKTQRLIIKSRNPKISTRLVILSDPLKGRLPSKRGKDFT